MGTHTAIRFHKPKTLERKRKSKFGAVPKAPVRRDKFSIIRYPLSTEKAMKKMEDENTMVFIVDYKTNKKEIRQCFQSLYNVKVKSINTLNRPDNKKKAYIRLSSESDSLTLANKIGII